MNLDRRQCLKGLAALPLCGAADWFAPRRKQRALVLVWLDGGASHLETFDHKPEAPPDIRGDVKGVAANVDGVFFGEALPQLAKRMDRMTLFRSITHGEGVHDRASEYLLTGHRPSPVLAHPCVGAVHAITDTSAAMPPFVAIPDAPTHGRQGFLPPQRAPFEVGGSPAKQDFRVRNLRSDPKHRRRIEWLAELDALDAPRSASEAARDSFLSQARALSLDEDARRVFDLGAESAETRATYGRHQLGQSCLLARRLVENGTRCVLVRDRGWDHHRDIKRAVDYGFPSRYRALDQSISALVDDLQRRERSDEVVVVVASEFGRTPRLNPAGGRDHWPRAQSVLAFGGGLKRGAVIGATDPRGEAPASGAMSPADLHATLITALGGDVERNLQTEDGRPFPVVERGGRAIREALS